MLDHLSHDLNNPQFWPSSKFSSIWKLLFQIYVDHPFPPNLPHVLSSWLGWKLIFLYAPNCLPSFFTYTSTMDTKFWFTICFFTFLFLTLWISCFVIGCWLWVICWKESKYVMNILFLNYLLNFCKHIELLTLKFDFI